MSKKILVLDDEIEFVTEMTKFLRLMNYQVEMTTLPAHALDIIKEVKPEVVIFDYKMPEMDGDAFLKAAKEISPQTQYILITGYRDNAMIQRLKTMGTDEILLKPVDLQALLKILEK